MTHEIFNYTLDQLVELEKGTTFTEFNPEIAWKLGSFAREYALEKFPHRAVVIDITLSTGHCLFRTATLPGTSVDNDNWVQRKVKSVFRFGKSSFFMGQDLRLRGETLESFFFVSPKEFSVHGGSIPIRVNAHDAVIGALTISGLTEEEDYLLAVEIVKKFLA